jgi:hypothetical protein
LTGNIYLTEDTLEHARTLATEALEFSDQSLTSKMLQFNWLETLPR